MPTKLNAPFPWFGGKSRIADVVWPRFGDCPNYVEPFFGSGAMLLACPHWRWPQGFAGRIHVETVNDCNGWLQNFWRATQHDPELTAYFADNSVHELSLHGRGDAIFYRWDEVLKARRMYGCADSEVGCVACAENGGACPLPETIPAFIEWLRVSPTAFCPLVGGWWTWGQASWIGDNWGSVECRSRPHLGRCKGVNRKRPHLGMGQGVNRKLPDVPGNEGECARHLAAVTEWFSRLRDRLRHVDVCCGDWERICGETPTIKRATPCAVFLDPPYSQKHGLETVYGDDHDPDVAERVRAWCIERGGDRRMRIALCGYDTEHGEPERHGWSVMAWIATGGYANQGSNPDKNRHRERVWFSPGCLRENFQWTARGQAEQLTDRLREFTKRCQRR